MKEYNLVKVAQLGHADPKYGSRFWCETSEQLAPVSFNLMQGAPQAGDKITAEEVILKTTQKGQEYHQLKKVKILGGGNQSAPTASGGVSEHKMVEMLELLKDNNRMLKMLTGEDEKDAKKMVDNGEELVDLDGIPFN